MALIECPECGGKVSDKALHVFIVAILYKNLKKEQVQYCPYWPVANQIALKVPFVAIAGNLLIKRRKE